MRGNVLRHLWGVEVDIVRRFLHTFRQHEFVGCDIASREADWVAEVWESDVPLAGSDAGVWSDSGGIDGDVFGGDIGAVRRGRSSRRYREGVAGEVGESNKEGAENHGEKHLN